ncbi:single-stranded-DNA-specific exonuclease RecJ [Rodentibacter pneumotropicus]|uniref:Single-stranded-DNA-specific exonuclease RecJ n=1 Tax=Rodentibacter pneumotropicus TaxID=758 RepID=A0A448MMV9_9PAST|nr:single-stranded-DNA-specific exonuclease RecJ [Rodentibacter pneumotropicus]
MDQRAIGQGKNHLKMLVEPMQGGPLLDAVAFNIDIRLYPDLSVKQARLAYKLDINEFRGNRNIQLLVDHIEPIDE